MPTPTQTPAPAGNDGAIDVTTEYRIIKLPLDQLHIDRENYQRPFEELLGHADWFRVKHGVEVEQAAPVPRHASEDAVDQLLGRDQRQAHDA